jgi:cytochrome b subunit of formate dehydrogenase
MARLVSGIESRGNETFIASMAHILAAIAITTEIGVMAFANSGYVKVKLQKRVGRYYYVNSKNITDILNDPWVTPR